MADNTTLNSGTGGDVYRSKDRSSVKTSVVTLDLTGGGASETLINGSMPTAFDTSTIYNGTTALTPTFASIAVSASGANQIVAANATKKIRVLRWSISASAAVNAKWQNGSTDVTGLHYMVANELVGGGYCPIGHFETAANTALNLNLSAATAVGGSLTYILV